MGYDPSFRPPQCWFCGLPHLRIARDALKQAEVAERPFLREFGLLFQVRLELRRGLQAIFGLPILRDWTSAELKIACQELPDWLVEELSAVWERGFAVRYSGNNQYGVPNYDFHKDGESATLTGVGDRNIINEAFNERMAAAQELMRLVIRAFGEIYVQGNQIDLSELDPFEDCSDKESFQELESMGAVQSAAETSRRFGGDFIKAMKDPEIQEGVRKWRNEYGLNYHDNGLWDFDERSAICYQHSSP